MADCPRRKFIIDCDTGVDDAVAILMALDAPDIDVIAITVVDGNCSLADALSNTLRVVRLAGKEVPVYAGCHKSLSANGVGSSDRIHSHDGLGGCAKDYEPCDRSLGSGHASQVLVDLINKHPGEVTLVALGPLTNLAVAYRLDDTLSTKLHKLVIMGGNTEGQGNVRIGAEFNFAVDPVAANLVLEETKCECQICGWELCGVRHAFSWEWFDNWMASSKSTRGEFINKIVRSFSKFRRERFPDTCFAICDPLAMSVALFPDIVVKSSRQRVIVETSSPHISGMMILEWREGLSPRPDAKKHEIILEIDQKRHQENMTKVMLV